DNADTVLLRKSYDVVELGPGILLILRVPVLALLWLDLTPCKALADPARSGFRDHFHGAYALPVFNFAGEKRIYSNRVYIGPWNPGVGGGVPGSGAIPG